MLDITKLKNIIPDNIYNELPYTMEKFNINTILRLGHFLSQCHHESGGFKHLTENLNYGKEGLLRTFPKYFKNLPNINYYARNPERIANLVYANRMGNGNEASGDGWKHRGEGCLQLTGKNNHYAFADYVNDPEIKANPRKIATHYALSSAAYFFEVNKLWGICDLGNTEEIVSLLTKRINGGYNGLADRISWFCYYMKILNN
jgi:putative chitinase